MHDVIVFHDDLDVELGKIKVKFGDWTPVTMESFYR